LQGGCRLVALNEYKGRIDVQLRIKELRPAA